MNSQKVRIQRALIDRILSEEFPIVSYDDKGRMNEINESQTVYALTPILCNETQATFEQDSQYRRDDIQTRTSWTFALRVKFDREVLLERFEESLCKKPIKIATDEAFALPWVTMRLTGTQVDHPVQQQGSTGTMVEFTFEAEQGRR